MQYYGIVCFAVAVLVVGSAVCALASNSEQRASYAFRTVIAAALLLYGLSQVSPEVHGLLESAAASARYAAS